MKKFAGTLILLIVGTLLSCPKPTGSTSPSKVWVVSTLAGSSAGSDDGPAAEAEFKSPRGVALDASGNLYVADKFNHRIRKITLENGQWSVSTLAGSTQGYMDGTSAKFSFPRGVAVDASGHVYVADGSNHRIRKITLENGQWSVSTLAGSTKGSENGTGTEAQFHYPRDVAVDASGHVYVADGSNHLIRKITPAGEVSTLAGSGRAGSANGRGTSAQFDNPLGVAVDSSGHVYVADKFNHRIRKITLENGQWSVSTLAGSTQGYMDGAGITEAQFHYPYGVAVDADGNVYVADNTNHRIRKITPEGLVSTIAGSSTAGSKNGAGTAAQFYKPQGVVVDASGNVYVADTGNNLIRKIEYKLP